MDVGGNNEILGKGSGEGGIGGPCESRGGEEDKGKRKSWSGGSMNGAGSFSKGKCGKGYQGSCWFCGELNRKAGEGKCGGKARIGEAAQEGKNEAKRAVEAVEIGGLWFICQVAKSNGCAIG